MIASTVNTEVRPSTVKKIGEVLLKNKLTFVGIGIVALIILISILAPIISPYDPNLMNMADRLQAPGASHIFGTDEMGRDVLSRVFYGARISIVVGVSIVIIAALIGCTIGSVSGYAGGRVDRLIMAATDMVLSFPSMVLALALTAALGPGLFNTMLAVCVVRIPLYIRLMRGQVLQLKREPYVKAALTFGAYPFWILIHHIVPNCMSAWDWRCHSHCFLYELYWTRSTAAAS